MSAISIPPGMGRSPVFCTLLDSLLSAPRTPVSKKPFVGSPDDYFAPRFTPQPTSRWREEFEELELLVRISPSYPGTRRKWHTFPIYRDEGHTALS